MKKKLLIIFIMTSVISFSFLFIKDKDKNIVKDSHKNKIIKDNNNELFSKYYNLADKKIKDMSLEEKIGQLFLIRYDDNLVDSYINNYDGGGFILFGRDFSNKTKDDITNRLKSLQKNSKYGLIFGVDEEGGSVVRVSKYKAFRDEAFSSPQTIYNNGGYEALKNTEYEKAELLKSIGINLNLAPVSDVSQNPDDFMYERSFGRNYEETSTYIKNMVGYAREKNIASCLKHFPGYGSNVDTHTGEAVDNRSLSEFYEKDFLPFKSGIESGVPFVLVSHNRVLSIDENYPASLSKNAYKILEEDLGFSGLKITDDLDMGALKKYATGGESAVFAISSGADMVITSDFIKMRDALIEAVNSKKIKIEDIDRKVRKIISFKYSYKILK